MTSSPNDGEAPLEAAAFDAFLLAIRVVLNAWEIDPPAAEFERPWTLLREIAEGRTTLTNPAEIAARFPQLGGLVYDTAGDRIVHDRATAVRILRGLGGAFDESGGADRQ